VKFFTVTATIIVCSFVVGCGSPDKPVNYEYDDCISKANKTKSVKIECNKYLDK
jgi:hypothetical protein